MRVFAVLIPLVLLLQACYEAPKSTAKKGPEPPDPPLTGRQAFQKMFPAARGWSVDAVPLQLQSYNMPTVKSGEGKAGAWQCVFVSPSKAKSKPYTWSAIESEGNLHKGVFGGLEQSWSGPSGQSMPFDIIAIRVDSDAALETAMKQADSKKFVKKEPNKPMTFILEKTRRFPDLAWRVMWGDTVGTSEYSVFVDATTGAYLERQ